MRKIIYAFLFLFTLNISGQSPAYINYQGLVRDVNGQPLISQTVAIEFRIIEALNPGTPVFTETITSVKTNSLGLFSVRIGTTQNLSSVNFSSGTFSLQVGLDPNNGNNFTAMGDPQLLVSVPFALHANSVPATYTNNILTIGNTSFTLGSGGYTPTLTLSGPDNNILGDGTNTVALNTYTVGTGLTMAGGPNYTISSVANSPSITGTGLLGALGGGGSFTLNVPTPSLSSSGNSITLNQGTVVSTATIPIQPQGSVTATGIATVTSSGTNTFNINVPAPLVSNTGNTITITQGSSNTSFTIPIPPQTSVSGTGMAGVTAVGINSFNVNVPSPTLVANSNTLIFTQGTLVSTATVPVQPPTNVTAAGIASVNSTGTNSFNITVPGPTLSNTGNTITLTQGTVVTTATVQAPTLVTSSGLGTVTSAGSNSFNINVPPPNLTANSNTLTLTQGTAVSTATVPMQPPTLLTSSGLGTVSTAGTNTFDINVPSPSLSVSSNTLTLTQGTAVTTATIFPQGLVTGSGIATVTSAGTNTFNVDVPAPQIAVTTTAGAAGVSSASPVSYSINIPPAITPSITGAGIAVVSPTLGNSFTVSVDQPTFAYSQSTGSLTSGTSSAFITPTLVVTGGTISVGPPSNSIAINTGTSAFWSAAGNAGTNPTVNFVGTTDNVALNFRTNNQGAGVIDPVLYNSAIGYQSLNSVSTGSFNTTMGYRSLNGLTSGVSNAAFGADALRSLTTGNNNTGIGSRVLENTSGSSGNTGVGFIALNANTTGSENTAVGHQAMILNQAGTQNVAVGSLALRSNVNGNFNTAVGYQAGYSSTGAANVFVGYLAGQNNTGSSNLFLGYQAGRDIVGSNKLVIANSATTVNPMIFGDFTTGNVSIGTATANHRLNVDGNIALENAASLAAPARIIGFPTASNGNHGNLTLQAKSNVFSGIAYTGGNLTLAAGDFNLSGASGPNGGIVTIRAGRNVFDGSGGGDIVFQAGGLTYTERMRITGVNGNVGIGTAAPGARLHVDVPNAIFQINDFAPGGGPIVNTVLMASIIGKANNGPQVRFNTQPNADFIDIGQNATGDFVVEGNDNIRFLVQNTGNIGIGTIAPNAPLQFANTIVNRKIVMWEGANNDHQFYGFGINGGTLRYQVDATSADHVFFAGTGAAASTELFRIKGTGTFKMGSETGTSQGPNYPTGGGMVIRRVYTTAQVAGSIVARTDAVQFERDGSYAGFRVNRVAGSGLEVCNCMGVNSAGAAVNRAYSSLAAGVTQVYTNADNIVFLHCIFGDPYYSSGGHITEVTITRQSADYFWIGTMTTTFNQ